jgi:hypothetical protein
MELSEIKKLVEKDMPIKDSELDLEALRVPQLHSKYLNLFHDERIILMKYDVQYKELVCKKREYYSGKMSKEQLESEGWEQFDLKILKSDMDIYLDADSDLAKMRAKMDYQKEKIEYLGAIIKSINNRNWAIRNCIEYRKFANGVN